MQLESFCFHVLTRLGLFKYQYLKWLWCCPKRCHFVSIQRPEKLILNHIYWHFSLFSLLQVLPGWLPHRRLHQRLPRRLLPTLHRPGLRRPGGALHPVHGELRRLQLLRPHGQGLQTLGVQQAPVAERTAEVLGEVPALHSLLLGLRVSPWQRVLLYLWVCTNLLVLLLMQTKICP